MKWKYYQLGDNDVKAKQQIIENLSMGAIEHTLSKKLLARFSEAAGSMCAIAFESLDLDKDYLYKYGTYKGGMDLSEAMDKHSTSWTDSPMWGLIKFIADWLNTSEEAIVLCENWAIRREHLSVSPRESRILCYQEEVYHILIGKEASNEFAIECALRESQGYWATGVCSICKEVPCDSISSEAFFDIITANVVHIFTPAFDGEGYLIWSPSVKA